MINPSRSLHRRSALRRFGVATAGCLVIAVGWAAAAQESAKEGQWISLFNGKDLDGWTVKITGYDANDNYADTFRVEDGVLKVSYDKYPKFDGKFGHLFTKRKYANYRLRVEYRFVGNQCPGGPSWAVRNSGAMIHSQSAASMRKDQQFPVSIEVQYLGGGEQGVRPTANVCTPGTHIVMGGKLITQHCNESSSETYRGDQWVTVEAEVHGNRLIKHIVNGKTVLEYEKPQLDNNDVDARALARDGVMLHEGHIALQAESHPIEFRKVEIMLLNE